MVVNNSSLRIWFHLASIPLVESCFCLRFRRQLLPGDPTMRGQSHCSLTRAVTRSILDVVSSRASVHDGHESHVLRRASE